MKFTPTTLILKAKPTTQVQGKSTFHEPVLKLVKFKHTAQVQGKSTFPEPVS